MNKTETGRETRFRTCRPNSDLRNLQTSDVWNLQTPDVRNLQKQPITRHPNRRFPLTVKAARR
jgi:hypothetical protein